MNERQFQELLKEIYMLGNESENIRISELLEELKRKIYSALYTSK
ncbi:hypothetical protein DFR59_102344 [Falsibacillus pallidus]|uniref:Uncharacterized protein n=1 Tax=Falsibacillus pallidus TaxID=493781 RepID=A0A370GQC8_9BACI|nr:hypothetical protein DFR59_102344 [Falsibacillus pallidus]